MYWYITVYLNRTNIYLLETHMQIGYLKCVYVGYSLLGHLVVLVKVNVYFKSYQYLILRDSLIRNMPSASVKCPNCVTPCCVISYIDQHG